VITPGYMKVGWVKVNSDPGKELGLDGCSYVFDGFGVSLPFRVPVVIFSSKIVALTVGTWELLGNYSNQMNKLCYRIGSGTHQF